MESPLYHQSYQNDQIQLENIETSQEAIQKNNEETDLEFQNICEEIKKLSVQIREIIVQIREINNKLETSNQTKSAEETRNVFRDVLEEFQTRYKIAKHLKDLVNLSSLLFYSQLGFTLYCTMKYCESNETKIHGLVGILSILIFHIMDVF
ncbi:predicted protein [Candida tropicalis MYA-3404]|uniref:Uncharacterized protein n=1 Tax=Candida tropicalis (strain ATCC MYA-3404 / T1) TaxID=294747 RepID=C5M5U4_CANTT|nr:predicted protein [Candida tropicalis MYA-3404]XP_002546952.1 predicted protein [Candida tropicalis MYA-3404]KAG4408234.1 hypothetical protein JTP64_001540 [Candida tropicalis]EER34364.1 predicted protein [Candida tropicalis MYA-3404]EER34397.1 predicted protein [Candida tropicalis MYA-3404]KAG4408268.1 hypothetical protein JTP64_001574 [Candida tropicalis]